MSYTREMYMLSRVANNLYWMGRYMERSEHFARYLSVQYFSSLDAPLQNQKEIALQSVADMVGIELPEENMEEELLVSVALDENNQSSIVSSVFLARENARGARDHISAEVWEAVNKFYHFVCNYPVDIYKTRGLFDFTQKINEFCSVTKGAVQNTLIHNETWALIKLGFHIECAIQVARMVISKLADLEKLKDKLHEKSMETHQWTTLLNSAEALDMSRKEYRRYPNKAGALEFVIFNAEFPRSIVYNLNKVLGYLERLSVKKSFPKDSVEFKIGKVVNQYQFLSYEDVEDNLPEFMEDTLSKIYYIHDLIEDEFLN